jgi:tetratricopeptide (TPR) repeat protein
VTQQFSEQEAGRHSDLTDKGWDLIEGEILQGPTRTKDSPGFLAKRKLQQAQRLFLEALEINPQGWSSMLALGKIHQRLGEHREALEWFEKAHRVNPAQPDLALEAGVAALELGEAKRAVEFCEDALGRRPDDSGLMSNLALAHLMAGELEEAERSAKEAVERNWRDSVSQNVLRIVQEVRLGEREAPQTLSDLTAPRRDAEGWD